MKRHTIRPHQPLRYLLFILIVSGVIGVGIWLLAEYSHWRLIREQMAHNQDYKGLLRTNQQLIRENESLRRELAMLRTSTKIDRRATAELQDDVVQLQNEIFQLTRELEFYRGIVSSSEDVDGLAIQGVQILPAREPHQYQFKLVLTRVEKSDMVAEGKVEVILEGSENGTARKLRLRDVMQDQSLSFEYRFKHFKRFEGLIDLPAAFKPRHVRVQLLPQRDSHARIERVFDWSDITL